MPRAKVNIIQDNNDWVTKDILAKSICDLSDGIGKLIDSGLNEKAVIVLLQDATGCSKRTIKHIFEAMAQLRSDYTHI